MAPRRGHEMNTALDLCRVRTRPAIASRGRLGEAQFVADDAEMNVEKRGIDAFQLQAQRAVRKDRGFSPRNRSCSGSWNSIRRVRNGTGNGGTNDARSFTRLRQTLKMS